MNTNRMRTVLSLLVTTCVISFSASSAMARDNDHRQERRDHPRVEQRHNDWRGANHPVAYRPAQLTNRQYQSWLRQQLRQTRHVAAHQTRKHPLPPSRKHLVETSRVQQGSRSALIVPAPALPRIVLHLPLFPW